MPRIIGIATQDNPELWMQSLMLCRGASIVEANLLGSVPNIPVDVWFVIIPKGMAPDTYAEWLQTLRAPIVLVTHQPKAASALVASVPMLTFVCHPLRAAEDTFTLLYLAKRRTAGTQVLDATSTWRRQLRLAA